MKSKSPVVIPPVEEDGTLCAYLSEKVLKKDWLSQEEDEAWEML